MTLIIVLALRLLFRLLFRLRFTGHPLSSAAPALFYTSHDSSLELLILHLFLPAKVRFVTAPPPQPLRLLLRRRWLPLALNEPLAVRHLLAILQQGTPLLLCVPLEHPELAPTAGLGLLARRSGCPLQPLALLGTDEWQDAAAKQGLPGKWFPTISLHAGPPFPMASTTGAKALRRRRLAVLQLLTQWQEAVFHGRQALFPGNNLWTLLVAAARRYGYTKVAAKDLFGSVSYRQVILNSSILSQGLAKLLGAETRVGVLLPTSIAHLLTLFALFRCGISPAIFNLSAGAKTNLDCAAAAGLSTILTSRRFVDQADFGEHAAHLAMRCRIVYLEDIRAGLTIADKLAGVWTALFQRPPQAIGHIILFTSGSEGKPKGVVLEHSHLIANIHQIMSVIDLSPHDRIFNPLPMFHSLGLTAATLLPLLAGVELFLYPSPLHYKQIPSLIEQQQSTILIATPTFLQGYAKACTGMEFRTLRYVIAGGEKLSEEVRQTWEEQFGLRIFEGYGTTETAPVISVNTPRFFRSGTVGRLLPGMKARLAAVDGIPSGGNLLVAGPNVMAGYLLGQHFVPAAEYHDCGDVVTLDADGYVRIVARLKRFTKISGEMISLDAVEQLALASSPGHSHAAVTIPDSRKGERIVLYSEDDQLTRQQLREAIVSTQLSMLMLPAAVIHLSQLPRLGSGKVDLAALRSLALQQALEPQSIETERAVN